MTYRLSAMAEADLTDIWGYSAQQWGVDQADLYVDALLRRFSWLPELRAAFSHHSTRALPPGFLAYATSAP